MSVQQEIIDSQPCVSCKDQTLSIVEIHEHGIKVSELFMCRSCQGPAITRSHELRQIFEGLLSSGLSRELANEVMIRWHI